jgi:UDP-N-acetylglucosamine pyrophosphorylase
MNNISILPQVGMHILQLQNVKRNKSQKMDIHSLQKKEEQEEQEEQVEEPVNNNNSV